MQQKLSLSAYILVGVMLFALFFGAGNLIFPASLGQQAGENIWQAICGFLITGVGLPFLGVLAIGFSGSRDLQELSSRIHPLYAIFFTSAVYLTIGPFFAAPRTGAVAYDIGIAPFISEGNESIAMLIFTFLFFLVTLLFSLFPSKIVDNVGKILTPGIVILIALLILMVIIKPMGNLATPQEAYATRLTAFFKGFTEGYNTMDALASLVFAIIVINVLRNMGLKTRSEILSATFKTSAVAALLLGSIYVGIAYLGATSTDALGLLETGGPVLSGTSEYYFGSIGLIILAVLIILACLTTSIGLVIACGEYFHSLIPKISYNQFVIFFSILCFVIANFGLKNIINYSIPVLMFLYPLAIVLMLLTFLSPLFHHAKLVYVAATIVTLFISIVDGFKMYYDLFEKTYPLWLNSLLTLYTNYLPLYNDGLGWLLPVGIVIVITGVLARLFGMGVKKADAS